MHVSGACPQIEESVAEDQGQLFPKSPGKYFSYQVIRLVEDNLLNYREETDLLCNYEPM